MKMPEEKAKKKLTLSVDEEVIEKAKKLDLNISEITEGVLRGFAFKPSELEKESLVDAYKTLFETMLPLLKDYMTGVEVGEPLPSPGADWVGLKPKIFLGQGGNFWISEFDEERKFEEIELYDFYEPKKILANFIKALSDAAEKRNERIAEIKIAKGIIDVIVGSIAQGKKKGSGEKPL